MTVIKLENVSKIYRSNGMPVTALYDINLAIEQGDFACVAGPSGSGKTSLLNLIGVIDLPTTGRVLVNGKLTSDLSRSEAASLRLENTGFIFQSFNLIPVLSAFENVEYVLMIKGVSKDERAERVMDVLRRVGLSKMAGKKPGELSGGEQQRVAVARAIVSSPPIVLADEPTGNLDSRTGMELLELFQLLNSDLGTTFVFSSHDRRIIDRASRIITMCDGKIEGPS